MPNAASPVSGPQGILPRLGLRPTSPQQAAGIRLEPAPSPPLDPPTPRVRSQGLRVGPCLTDSVEKLIPSSGMVVTPKVTSPAARNRRIRSVSCRAMTPFMLRLPTLKGTPLAIGTSLIRNGTAANGP